MFGFFKTKGFDFENTHMVDTTRMQYGCCNDVGVYNIYKSWGMASRKRQCNKNKKTICRLATSIFRHGLDFIRPILLNHQRGWLTKAKEIVDIF